MKKIITLFALMMAMVPNAISQSVSEAANSKLQITKEAIKQWDIEQLLDSLDQEKLPKAVTGGLIMNANISNFIITNPSYNVSSYMKVGGELGGFIDFRVTKHFAIQGRAMITAEQNQFGIGDTKQRLWSFGIDIPVYFLGRFGNMEKGYLQFGAGPFTHFTFASNIAGKYSNNLAEVFVNPDEPYAKLYVLHDNHFGITATIGYEFPLGIQINANYLVSLSDIFNYYKQEGRETTEAIYPQRISIGIAYRWK
ncbi:MAG: PorT family protein [Paludibacteraceae bacterium]|nr:PorT family protein [Paludibacteraceae bacterium]